MSKPHDNLWLEVLEQSEMYQKLPELELRSVLSDGGLPNYLIDAFLVLRSG